MPAIFETAGAVTATSLMTSVTAGADAKGAWVQLIDSTTITTKYVYVNAVLTGTHVAYPTMIDIGVGSDGSEDVVINNIQLDSQTAVRGGMQWYGPYRVDITSGSRVAARGEGTTAGGTELFEIQVVLCDTELSKLTSPSHNSYGVTLGSTPKDVSVDPGAVAHTKGVYSEVTATASATAQAFFLHVGNRSNTVMTDANWLIDIATGSAGSETVVVANLATKATSGRDTITPQVFGPFPADLIQSARVAVNAQCDITDATDRLFGVTLSVISGTVAAGAAGGAAQLVSSGALVG